MDFKNDKVWLVILCLLTSLAYLSLHDNFNIYYEDDSWTISNVWNYQQLEIEEDVLFLEADAPGRKHIFSKLYNAICGQFLSRFGWTKSNVFLLNCLFIFLATFVWWFILQRLPVSRKTAKVVTALIPIFPPFFFAAHTGRPDAMTFLLVSLMFLSFIRQYYWVAGWLLMMAIETHIMGVIGAFYMLAYTLYQRNDFYDNPAALGRLLLGSSIGVLFGLLWYAYLHHATFSLGEMVQLISSKTDMVSPLNNYLLTYFTDFDWAYHLLEFGLLVVTVRLFIKNRFYNNNQFITILLVVLVLSTFLTRRENRNYILYVFPAILLMYVYTYEQLRKLPQFLGAVVCILGMYYGSIFYAHRGFDFQKMTNKIRVLTKVEQHLPIVGMPDVWFAAQQRTFYPMHTHRDFNRIKLDSFYLVESDFLAHRNRAYQPLKDYFFENYDTILQEEWVAYQDKKMRLWKLSRGNEPLPRFIKREYPGWRKVVKSYLLAEF